MYSPTSKLLQTIVGYTIITMLLTYVWHLIAFPKLYESFGIYSRKDPIIPLGLASMIVQGFAIAHLFPLYAQNEYSIGKALTFSFIIGLIIFSVSTLAATAKIEVFFLSRWLLVQVTLHIIQFSLTGILLWIIYRNK